jgi:type 1 glutamine amidotransferase
MFLSRGFPVVLALAGALLLAGGCASEEGTVAEAGSASPEGTAGEAAPRFRVLVFSKTEGFRHASIPTGKRALQQLGAEHGFAVDTTENAAVFTSDSLSRYDAVVFLSTTGNVFNQAQQEAFTSYMQAGGGFVGVHAAADTEYDWPWYGDLVGAYFEGHPSDPNVRTATVRVTERTHPSTRMLPGTWERTDEWYNYDANPRGSVEVLATVDESTYEGGTMVEDHPIVWKHQYDGGRAWYTGGGHTKESFTSEPRFMEHLLGGIEWAAGEA